jgi:hypothetical protein
MPPFIPNAAATGLGSMPYTSPDEAIAHVGTYFPEMPYWPQLPKRGIKEGLIHQVCGVLLDTGLLRLENDRGVFARDADDWADRLTDFYGILLAAEAGDPDALNRFGLNPDTAAGYFAFMDAFDARFAASERVKGQVVGPLTMGFQLRDEEGQLAFYDDELREILVGTLTAHARWQCRELAGLKRPVIMFVDDPSIAAYGRHSHIALDRAVVIDSLRTVLDAIRDENALSGLHSCDAADWDLAFAAGMDILSLDAYQFGNSLATYRNGFSRFLDGGGTIAWGIVPTLKEAFSESPQSLYDRLVTLQDMLFDTCAPDHPMFRQSLITPACGTGLLDTDLAEAIYSLTASLSEYVQRRMS